MGAYGGVHSNGNLTVSQNANVAQTATAVGTGTYTTNGTIGGFHAGGQDPLYIPRFVTEPTATSSPHIQDYIVQAADVVLLDIGMPGMDGYEACRRIRAKHGQTIALIAVSGWGQDADKQMAMNAGFDAHLTKPADPEILAQTIARLARRTR
jgi:CheY-like chemotaxis protein